MTRRRPFSDPAVAAAYAAFPAELRPFLLDLRDLIFATAAATRNVGPLTETLKWGEPSYLPATPRTGTTVRIGAAKGQANHYSLFVNCKTTLVSSFKELYPEEFDYHGARELRFTCGGRVPNAALRHCIAMALTYHTRSGK
jgi:Domain of unknown function (DU1801)